MTALAIRKGSRALARNPAYLAHKASHAKALRADMRALPMTGDPDSPMHPRGRWFDPDTGKMRAGDPACAGGRDLVLYAAALAKKRGELPDDLAGWIADAGERADGRALVTFRRGDIAIPIAVAHLDFDPTAPAIAGPVVDLEPEAYRCEATGDILSLPAPEAGERQEQAEARTQHLAGPAAPTSRAKPKEERFKPKTIYLIGRRGCRAMTIGF